MNRSQKAASLTVTAFNVGHGDAILLQWREKKASWTALIDGGASPSTLRDYLMRAGVTAIDLVVATHLDTDHVGGLIELTAIVEVGEYWGPALPAFQRHSWLFGQRGTAAIRRGAEIEDTIASADVPIIYPVEGYSSTPLETRGPRVAVLSPPPKLIKALLIDEDISWLTTGTTTPMGWLLDDQPREGEGENSDFVWLDAGFRTGALSPAALRGHVRQSMVSKAVSPELRQQWALKQGCDPEFFADPLLNNTSIVIWVEVQTGSITHRLLFPGDLENWTYLFAANSRGLQPDILKASHHGGRVFLEADRCEDELLRFLRPRAILISANGTHGLPRNHLRQAAIAAGSTVFCTSERNTEFVSVASQDDDKSCFDHYACGSGGDVVLTLDGSGIRASKQACHSGFGIRPGTVIELRHHIIDPSPVIHRLFENELRKYIRWVKKTLTDIHIVRRQKFPDPRLGNKVVSQEQLESIVRERKMHTLLPHIRTVLSEGHRRQQFWASTEGGYYSSNHEAYCLPSNTEKDDFLQAVRSKKLILFQGTGDPFRMDPMTFLAGLPDNGLALLSEAYIQLPQQVFHASLWPVLLREFTKNWKCQAHHSGVIGLVLEEDVSQTYLDLLEVYGKTYGWNNDANDNWHMSFNWQMEEHLLNGPVVANMEPVKRNSTPPTPSWGSLLESWFAPSTRSLEQHGWKQRQHGSNHWKKEGDVEVEVETWSYRHGGISSIKTPGRDVRKAFREIAGVLSSSVSRAW